MQKHTIVLFKNCDFPTLEACYSNYASSKIKANQNVFFQKSSPVIFFDKWKYVSSSKSYILPSHKYALTQKKSHFPIYLTCMHVIKISQFQVNIFNVLVFPVSLLLVVLERVNVSIIMLM